MLYRPTVIAQILSTQANYIDRNYGQMFYYTDQNQIWYDTQNKGRLLAADILILQYERDRTNYIPSASDFPAETNSRIPSSYLNYVIVYVVETNCLYRYQSGVWSTLYGTYGTTTVAQTYLPNGTIKTVVADDVTTNGILNDGSVVIRDNNKMICGQLYSDGYVMNVRSLIGGCVNIDPSGYAVGNGCLQLISNPSTVDNTQTSIASLNSNLVVFGNITTAKAEDWYKQYRLITEDIEIISNTTIAAGSLLKAGSKLDQTNYDVDTTLSEDISAAVGLIKQESKLYKDSVINDDVLVPPFMFDTEKIDTAALPVITFSNDVELSGTNLVVNMAEMQNIGDTCYITYDIDISKAKTISIKDTGIKYTIEYLSKEGIQSSAKIVYYLDNKVKVLP